MSEHALDPTRPLLIGRKRAGAAVDIEIDHLTIARQHLWIGFERGRWWIEDAQSTSGTFVNGLRNNRRHTVEENDQIRIGECILTLVE